MEILNFKSITKPVYGVGHDWRVTLLSRMEVYHSSHFVKLAFLTIGYRPLGQRFDLDVVNKMTQEMLGCALCEYFEFFTRDPEAV